MSWFRTNLCRRVLLNWAAAKPLVADDCTTTLATSTLSPSFHFILYFENMFPAYAHWFPYVRFMVFRTIGVKIHSFIFFYFVPHPWAFVSTHMREHVKQLIGSFNHLLRDAAKLYGKNCAPSLILEMCASQHQICYASFPRLV